MMSPKKLGLFDAFGIELEYMIVDRDTLDVRPICEKIFLGQTGTISSDFENGDITWSNELVAHLIELKVSAPAPSLMGNHVGFHHNVQIINKLLEQHNACLLPTAAHPWMDPDTQTTLWAHDYSAVYEAYDRIFNCRGHGWSNLQSTHLNLPFDGDDEFGLLHAAIRMILGVIPTLAASSPIIEGKVTGMADTRLDFYCKNTAKIPSVAGRIIPEPVYDQQTYYEVIFEKSFADTAPYDPDGVLRDEFLNSRGAIARFGRGSIEIRLIDIQECPAADEAILLLIVAAVRYLVNRQKTHKDQIRQFSTESLRAMLDKAMVAGDLYMIEDQDFLDVWEMNFTAPVASRDFWQTIIHHTDPDLAQNAALQNIFTHGTLARRMVSALPENPSRGDMITLYRKLAACLQDNHIFTTA